MLLLCSEPGTQGGCNESKAIGATNFFQKAQVKIQTKWKRFTLRSRIAYRKTFIPTKDPELMGKFYILIDLSNPRLSKQKYLVT